MTAIVEEGEGDGKPEMGDLVGVREGCVRAAGRREPHPKVSRVIWADLSSLLAAWDL